jgi:signal transduction histidine kinase
MLGGDAVAIAPFPLEQRIVTAALVSLFIALGFYIPGTPHARLARFAVDVVFLLGLALFSPVSAILSILLVTRARELRPRDGRLFGIAIFLALCVSAVGLAIGVEEHRAPNAVMAPLVLAPVYGLVIALVIVSDNLRQSRIALAAANAELALRAARSEEIATLSERYRIGRELQEEVGRELQSIGEQLERSTKQRGADPEGADVLVFRAQRAAEFTLAALRRAVADLRKDSLARATLAASLGSLCEAFSSTSGLTMDVAIAEVALEDPLVITNLERIAREALINVARHSEASNVRLTLELNGDQLGLLIEDNGIGYDRFDARSGSGTAIMRERAALIGGKLAIESTPGHGTRVRVTLKYPPSVEGGVLLSER